MSLLKNVALAALWPEMNLAMVATTDNTTKPVAPQAPQPVAPPSEHLTVVASIIPKFLLALLCWQYTVPSFDEAKTYQFNWVMTIVARDLAMLYILCGGWDWLLYFSPFASRLHKFKYNPKYPSSAQVWHDVKVSTLATVLASVQEIVLMNLWATGAIPLYNDFWAYPIRNFLWLASMPYWRITHFFWLHRAMHPWRTKSIPDLGKFLYKHVHSLHHKSYNPTAFSGINMHPVESIGYFSVALLPCFFIAHPLIALTTKIDLSLAAQLGHDGHAAPGSGSYPHYLHHAHFEINYGESYVPWDHWLGTFSATPPKSVKPGSLFIAPTQSKSH